MKTIIKSESANIFIREIIYDNDRNPMRPSSSGSTYPDSFHIKCNVGVDVGDKVVFDLIEYTSISNREIPLKIEYICQEFDSVSHKLVKVK